MTKPQLRLKTVTRGFVELLSTETLLEILANYDVLEATGVIGETPLRLYARQLQQQLMSTDAHIMQWMTVVALEAARELVDRLRADK